MEIEGRNLCADLQEVSPENKACAWCERFCINLDREGRICARCENEPLFRARLEAHFTARRGAACKETAWCERFATATNEEQCAACRSDPALRAYLFGQWQAREEAVRIARQAGCRYRKELLRKEPRRCCGGKVQTAEIYRCQKRGEIVTALCGECPDWEAAETASNESVDGGTVLERGGS
jgi:hypothetical protein